jgi:hypothetical protein
VSITSNRIHERIEWLVAQANDFLPSDVYLGYALCHTHGEDETVISDADILTTEHDLKANMRKELERRVLNGKAGADTDLANFPANAGAIANADVIFDLYHIPTGISVVRVYTLVTLRNLATDDTKTPQQKRNIVRTQLQSFYADLQARLP